MVHWIGHVRKDDGDRAGRRFGRERCGYTRGHEDLHGETDQFGGQGGERRGFALPKAEFDDEVLAFDIAHVAQAVRNASRTSERGAFGRNKPMRRTCSAGCAAAASGAASKAQVRVTRHPTVLYHMVSSSSCWWLAYGLAVSTASRCVVMPA